MVVGTYVTKIVLNEEGWRLETANIVEILSLRNHGEARSLDLMV